MATAIARALSAAPRPLSSFWWKSRYFLPVGSCMRTATPTWAASTEPALSTGNSLSTTFSLGSAFISSIMSSHRAFAVAAIVVEELDEGDVAVLVAERDVARRVEDRIGILGDAGLVLLGFGGGLALAQFGHRLFEHLGMGDQIVPDDALDVAALDVGEALRGSRQRRAAKSAIANRAGARRRSEGIGKSFMGEFPGRSREGRLLEYVRYLASFLVNSVYLRLQF